MVPGAGLFEIVESIMSDKADARACWFIAVGNNHGWGRAETEKEAMANMHRNGGRATEWSLYRCTEGTYVNDMGGLNYPTVDGQPAPEMIGSHRRVK
jgi:hypothetical protein